MKLAPRRMLRCDAGRNIPRRQGTQKVIGRFLVQVGLADLNMEERPMKVILLAGTVAASTVFGAYAAAGTQLSQAECDSLITYSH